MRKTERTLISKSSFKCSTALFRQDIWRFRLGCESDSMILFCPPIRWLIINRSCWMLICTGWWFSSVNVAPCWDFKQLFPPTRGHAAWKQIGTQFSSSGSRSWKGHGLQRHTEFWHCLMRSEQSHLCLIFWALSKRQIPQGHRWGLHIFFSPSFAFGCLHFIVWIHSAGNPGVWPSQYT